MIAVAATVAAGGAVAGGGESASGAGEPSQAPDVQAGVSEQPTEPTRHELPCTGAQEPANFSLYSLGENFEDLPLTAVLRDCRDPSPGTGPSPVGRNTVSYIYGDCDASTGSDGGCAPPLEIQIAPACERSVADYDYGPSELGERRGVPSAEIGSHQLDGWLELYTADATVVIFANNPKQGVRAADALQPVADDAAPADFPPPLEKAAELAPPVAGALSGELSCESPEASSGP